jgi:hypothetical protein
MNVPGIRTYMPSQVNSTGKTPATNTLKEVGKTLTACCSS